MMLYLIDTREIAVPDRGLELSLEVMSDTYVPCVSSATTLDFLALWRGV
jgi:hypothetical protein